MVVKEYDPPKEDITPLISLMQELVKVPVPPPVKTPNKTGSLFINMKNGLPLSKRMIGRKKLAYF